MKNTPLLHRSTARGGSAIALALITSLALPTANAKPGKGNGGGGDDPSDPGLTINPMPDLVSAPITYTLTEITWPYDKDSSGNYVNGFEGSRLNDVNNSGVGVGDVLRPKPAGAPADWLAFRYGVVNVALDSDGAVVLDSDGRPESSATWVDLNDILSEELFELNALRGDGPWRIATGEAITNAGLVACRLIPADQDAWYSRYWTAYYGRTATPTLLAVADLARLADSTADPVLTLIDPFSADPDQDVTMLTEAGHVLVYNSITDSNDERVANAPDIFEFDPVAFSYQRVTPSANYPFVNDVSSPGLTINSSLQLSFRDVNEGSFSREIYRGSIGGTDDLWWASDNPLLRPQQIAEDGTLYVEAQTTVTKGRNKGQKRNQIYHLLSPTERTPLSDPEVDGNTYLVGQPFHSVSSAPGGEEEVIFGTVNDGIQIYKPNFESRFALDLQLPQGATFYGGEGNSSGPFISGPYNQGVGVQSSPGEYYGGYVAYYVTREADSVNFLRAYILTPSQ